MAAIRICLGCTVLKVGLADRSLVLEDGCTCMEDLYEQTASSPANCPSDIRVLEHGQCVHRARLLNITIGHLAIDKAWFCVPRIVQRRHLGIRH
jgi:hypothetical protein